MILRAMQNGIYIPFPISNPADHAGVGIIGGVIFCNLACLIRSRSTFYKFSAPVGIKLHTCLTYSLGLQLLKWLVDVVRSINGRWSVKYMVGMVLDFCKCSELCPVLSLNLMFWYSGDLSTVVRA
jgi:hypothetical protein